ncbi:MAG TPA: hypothetical protein PKI14_07930 [Fervidobacterium sp.]|nr:hypothetical protein [Fervidobacterium sp.]
MKEYEYRFHGLHGFCGNTEPHHPHSYGSYYTTQWGKLDYFCRGILTENECYRKDIYIQGNTDVPTRFICTVLQFPSKEEKEVWEEEHEEEVDKDLQELLEDYSELISLNEDYRVIIEKLFPRKVLYWIIKAEHSITYNDVPIPSFLKEVWNSNWDDAYQSATPTRIFEGEVRKGIKVRIELGYSAIEFFVNWIFLFRIPLRKEVVV